MEYNSNNAYAHEDDKNHYLENIKKQLADLHSKHIHLQKKQKINTLKIRCVKAQIDYLRKEIKESIKSLYSFAQNDNNVDEIITHYLEKKLNKYYKLKVKLEIITPTEKKNETKTY